MECSRVGEMESQNQVSKVQEPVKGTTFVRTCFNGLNALSGIGILSISFALSEGGWLSLILLVVAAVVCCYTGLLQRRCMDTDPAIKSYPDVGDRAFGHKGRVLVSVFMCLELYLVAVEFLILAGDNLDKLFPNLVFKFGGLKLGGKKGFVLLTALVMLPTTWLSLDVLAFVSAGGVLASIMLVFCVVWAGTVDGVGFGERGLLLNWGGLPTAISLYVFCYCGHAIFPTLSNSMKDKIHFSKVLLVCYIVSTFSYGSMAILGYLMYGERVKSQVTLNLPINKIVTKIAIYATLLNPLTKYAVIITPIAESIEDKFLFRNNKLFSILIRTTILISTAVVALTVPFFAYVMAFIGAFLSVTVSVIFPCLCYLRINKAAPSFGLELVIVLMTIVVGAFVVIVGTYTSVKQIVNYL